MDILNISESLKNNIDVMLTTTSIEESSSCYFQSIELLNKIHNENLNRLSGCKKKKVTNVIAGEE